MKQIALLFLSAITLVSFNVFAYEGHGFRILSSTIESSPGAVGGFKPAAPSLTKKTPGVVFAWSQAYDAEGYPGENVVLKGNHSFNATNYTKQSQTYTYKYELNCDGQFFRKVDRVEVRPGGVVSDTSNSYLTTFHRQPGLFRINAATDVTGEASNNHVGVATLRIRGQSNE